MYIVCFDESVFHAPKGNCNVVNKQIVWKDEKNKVHKLPCEYVREMTTVQPNGKIQTFDYGTR